MHHLPRPVASLLLALLFPALAALAVPAQPGWKEGSSLGQMFTFQLVGDEFLSWALSREGHTLLMDAQGQWRHARLQASGALEATGAAWNPSAPSEDSRGLRPTPQWISRHVGAMRDQRDLGGAERMDRVEGQWNLLLILIRYPDQGVSISPTLFSSMMNDSGWHGTGSFNDYYHDMSYGRFSTLSTVSTWHVAAHEHDYYGYNQGWDPARQLVREAVLAADSLVDFSQFDNNGDGTVDGLLIVHSGHGAEEGDQSNIWSHRWGLWDLALELDGVTVNDYTIQPELQNGSQSAIGVYVHEFGHALNLPDLYDTDYSSSGVGSWCVMSGGSWGGGGSGGNAHTPSCMSAWCRQALGWSTLTTTETELVDYGLPAVHLSDEVLRLDLDQPGQYFLVENRRQAAWDRHQAAQGLYVWHVDETMGGNSQDDHYLVDLEQADGRRDLNQGAGSDGGDIFPGTTNNRLFSSTTQPSSEPYGGGSSDVSISGIGDSADTLRATFFQRFSHQDLQWQAHVVAGDDGNDNWPDPGESFSLSFQLVNSGMALDSLLLVLSSPEEGLACLVDSLWCAPVPHNTPWTSPDFTLQVQANLAPGSYPLELVSRDATGWEQNLALELQVGRLGTLVLLDGAGEAIGPWYGNALSGLGQPSELRHREAGSAAPQDLSAYPRVMWVTGASASPLSSADIGALGTYLGQGGHVLLSGQHLLQGLTQNGRNLLGADPGESYEGAALLRGISAGGLFTEMESILLSGANGAWNQEMPAQGLVARAGSQPVARWGSSGPTTVLRREDPAWNGGRLLVAGCSLESAHGAGSLLSLQTVLGRILPWLDEGTLVGVDAPQPLQPATLVMRSRPNPFNPATLLELDLPRAGEARLQVWNVAGQRVRDLSLGRLAAGGHAVSLDLGGQASGLYVAELQVGPERTVTRLVLLR